jgi:hypothetical protein
MTGTADPEALQGLAEGLSGVAARLGPKEAGEAVATLSQALTKTTNPYALWHLAEGLSGVATRLGLKEGARAGGAA